MSYSNDKIDLLKACGFAIKEKTKERVEAAYRSVDQFFEHCESVIEEAGGMQNAMENFAPLTPRQKQMLTTYFFNGQQWENYKEFVSYFGLPPEGLCWDDKGKLPQVTSNCAFDLQKITKIATFQEEGLKVFLEVGGQLIIKESNDPIEHSLASEFKNTLSCVFENNMHCVDDSLSIKNALNTLSFLLFKEWVSGNIDEDFLRNEVFGGLALISNEWADLMLDQEFLSESLINKSMALMLKNQYFIENQQRWRFLEVKSDLAEKWICRVIKNENKDRNDEFSMVQRGREFVVHLPQPIRQMIKENHHDWFYGVAYDLDGQKIDVIEDKNATIVIDMSKEQSELLLLEMIGYFHKRRDKDECSEKQNLLYYNMVLKAAAMMHRNHVSAKVGDVCLENYFYSAEAENDIENINDSKLATKYAEYIFKNLDKIDSQYIESYESDYDSYLGEEEGVKATYVLKEEGVFIHKTWEEVRSQADHVTQKLMDNLMRLSKKNLVNWGLLKREDQWGHFGPLIEFLEKNDLQEKLNRDIKSVKEKKPVLGKVEHFRF